MVIWAGGDRKRERISVLRTFFLFSFLVFFFFLVVVVRVSWFVANPNSTSSRVHPATYFLIPLQVRARAPGREILIFYQAVITKGTQARNFFKVSLRGRQDQGRP